MASIAAAWQEAHQCIGVQQIVSSLRWCETSPFLFSHVLTVICLVLGASAFVICRYVLNYVFKKYPQRISCVPSIHFSSSFFCAIFYRKRFKGSVPVLLVF